jgi:hypothetical protein
MEFLEHHPVADHVLDIVRHHGEHIGRELDAESGMAHRRERVLRGRGRRLGTWGEDVQGKAFMSRSW